MDERYQIPLFEGIPESEFAWLIQNSQTRRLAKDEFILHEGGAADVFFIVLEGEIQVSRHMDGAERVLGTTPRGIIGGELALLNDEPSQVTGCAILPTEVMAFTPESFRQIFTHAPTVGGRILKTATQRMQNLATAMTQQQKMAALGKFSAGIAHELNNPSAAARRASQLLNELLPRLQLQAIQLNTLGLSAIEIQSLAAFQQDATTDIARQPVLSPLEQGDREDEIVDWLTDSGLDDESGGASIYEMAATFVSAGLRCTDIEGLLDAFPQTGRVPLLHWLHNSLAAARLLNDIQYSTTRISDLVAAIKQYTYMDQAPVQDIDIHQSLDNTLRILQHKLKKVKVQREYAPHLPTVSANGSELNQVWTNLIDNAIDALESANTTAPVVRLITRHENAYVMVEVADNGPGIPKDVYPHIFEPFFTTKEVGKGTGLGLDTTYRIIQQHKGTMDVQSQPGLTRFIVRLPVEAKAD